MKTINKEARRTFKKLYKFVYNKDASTPIPHLTNSFVRYSESGDCWKKVWFFDTSEEHAFAIMNIYGIPVNGIGINSAYDCTGITFAYPVQFIEAGNRTIAIQRYGIDV